MLAENYTGYLPFRYAPSTRLHPPFRARAGGLITAS